MLKGGRRQEKIVGARDGHETLQPVGHGEISFTDVQALTIPYVDEFLGRFLTERAGAQREPALITLTVLI